MSNATTYPLVDVAVVLILDSTGERLLVDHNPRWSGFSLPMTKLGAVPAAAPGSPTTPEPAEHAAVRAAVDVLGRPLPPTGRPARLSHDVPPWHQSGRDGEWKRYRYHLFALKAAGTPHPRPGHVAVWLTPAELESHEPVSPTVRHVLTAVRMAVIRTAVGMELDL